MRKIIIGLLLLLSVSASAQWQQTGSKVRYVTGIGIPTKDTAAGVLADSSQILIRPADSSLYVKYKRTWMRVGGGGGSIAGSGTTNYIPKFTSSSVIGNSQIFDNGTNVGIGTASPWEALSIPFNSKLSFGSSTYPLSISRSSAGNLITTISDNYDVSNTRIDFVMRNGTANQNTPLSLLSSGNVGMGTTDPDAKLRVAGTYNGTQAIFGLTDGRGLLIGTASNGTNEAVSILNARGAGAGTLQLQTDGADRLRIGNTGNVMVNTTTDNGTDKLQVNGGVNVSTLATTNNLSVTTNATVGGNLTTGSINATSGSIASLSGSTFSPSQLNSNAIFNSSLITTKGLSAAYTNISATYTTTVNDYFINITSGTFTLNFISAVTYPGLIQVIKNSGAGTITLDPSGTQTIDGNTTVTMNVQNQTYVLMSDGENWKIISKYL